MPELPEVEIVKRGMEPAFEGRQFTRVILNRPDLRFPITKSLPQDISGRAIKGLQRRGKYILCFVDGGAGFVLHLGMSGVIKVLAAGDSYEPKKHDHVVFEMNDGGRVVFNDPRRFGSLLSCYEESWQQDLPFAKMGPEPLGNGFSGEVLFAALQRRTGPVKAALLDQAVVAGVGNIYACEALFMAHVSPLRAACDLSADECDRLARAVKDVLAEAIEAGGSSLRDYRNTKGDLGYFQHNFKVYDREGHVCPACEDESVIVGRVVQSGRSSFYCSVCQV